MSICTGSSKIWIPQQNLKSHETLPKVESLSLLIMPTCMHADLRMKFWERVVGDATAPSGGIGHYGDVLLHLSLQV